KLRRAATPNPAAVRLTLAGRFRVGSVRRRGAVVIAWIVGGPPSALPSTPQVVIFIMLGGLSLVVTPARMGSASVSGRCSCGGTLVRERHEAGGRSWRSRRYQVVGVRT